MVYTGCLDAAKTISEVNGVFEPLLEKAAPITYILTGSDAGLKSNQDK